MTFMTQPSCTVSAAVVSLTELGGDDHVTAMQVNTTPHLLTPPAPFKPLSKLPPVAISPPISPTEILAGTNNTIEFTVNNISEYTGLFVCGNLTITYTNCATVDINKDLRNNTGQPANDLEILLAGSHAVLNHFDGYPANHFASFAASPAAGGNTLLSWSNPNNAVLQGQIVHLGFQVSGSAVNILGVSWTQNGKTTGCAQQVSTHTFLWGAHGSQIIYVNNGLACHSVTRYVGDVTVEWHARQVPLADLNARTRRDPIRTDIIRHPPSRLAPEATAKVNVPEAPPNATFGVIVQKVSTNASLSGPDVTTDFLEFPVAGKSHQGPATRPQQPD
jgi:hypothetical protein